MLRSLARRTSTSFAATTANISASATRAAMQSDVTRSTGPVFFSSMPLPPRFSSNTDSTTAVAALRPLITPAQGGRWTLTTDGEALERSFKFKTFGKTWDFMNAVATECQKMKHHPEWSNVYNTTYIRWTTHYPKGLSEKDLDMAAICDALAKDFGEMASDESNADMASLASEATAVAGNCCVPKSKR